MKKTTKKAAKKTSKVEKKPAKLAYGSTGKEVVIAKKGTKIKAKKKPVKQVAKGTPKAKAKESSSGLYLLNRMFFCPNCGCTTIHYTVPHISNHKIHIFKNYTCLECSICRKQSYTTL